MNADRLIKLGIDLRNRWSGNTKTTCPKCASSRKKSKDTSLSVDIDEGVWNCHHCGWSGSVNQYVKPDVRPEVKTEGIFEFFAKRGISQDTVKTFSISESVEWMPQTQKEHKVICFNYFMDGELINIKFKTADKHFKMVKDARKIPYNIDSIKDKDARRRGRLGAGRPACRQRAPARVARLRLRPAAAAGLGRPRRARRTGAGAARQAGAVAGRRLRAAVPPPRRRRAHAALHRARRRTQRRAPRQLAATPTVAPPALSLIPDPPNVAAMGDAPRDGYHVTPEAYLAAERQRAQKHEYLAGVEYAMAGASAGHNRITGNVFAELRRQLDGSPCEAFTADMKVRIRTSTAEFYYYPDVAVDCSGVADAAQFAEQPRVIVEVLSPDTERIDRGEKLRNYQALPSLDAYVLVDQHRLAVLVHRRSDGGWTRELLTEKAETLSLPTIGCSIPLAAIYQRTGL